MMVCSRVRLLTIINLFLGRWNLGVHLLQNAFYHDGGFQAANSKNGDFTNKNEVISARKYGDLKGFKHDGGKDCTGL